MSKINIIAPSEHYSIKIRHKVNVITDEDTKKSIQREIHLHTLVNERRKEVFEAILNNEHCDSSSFRYILSGLGGMIGSVMSTVLYTMPPVHNVLANPEYWYESAIQLSFSVLSMYAAHIMFRCSYYMNIDLIKNKRQFLMMWFILTTTLFILFPGSYLIWSNVLGFRYPLPLLGYLEFVNMIVTALTTIWFSFPKEWRTNARFRTRLKFCILAMLVQNLQTLEYGVVTKLFLIISGERQWIVALFLPAIREINTWMVIKLASRSADGDKSGTTLMCSQGVIASHTLFLAYTVGSIATNMTSFVIIVSDFLINIFHCFRIIYLRNKEETREAMEKQIRLLQELVLNETVEVMVPLCYLTCFVMAYFGPNGELIGNIKNSWWQYTAVQDVGRMISYISLFFFIDSLSLIISSFLLWNCCKINLFRAYAALQKEFAWPFSICLAIIFNGVSTMNIQISIF